MKDPIERQMAIDAMINSRSNADVTLVPGSYTNGWRDGSKVLLDELLQVVLELPSAQPEIIYCKDCKWYELPSHRITENCVRWMKSNGILLPIKPNDFCSYAERRTDGSDRQATGD